MLNYFIANLQTKPSDDQLIELGLGHIFSKDSPIACMTVHSQGPSGQPGVLLGRNQSQMQYHPDRQTWLEMPGIEGAWFGFETDNPPTPEQLARKKQISGHSIEINGSSWLVPMTRRWRVLNELPTQCIDRKVRFDGKDWVFGDVLPHLTRLTELGEQIFECFLTADEDGKIKLPDNMLDICCELLHVNYFVSKYECGELGLVTAENVWPIMQRVIDLPGLHELQKKTETDTASSSSNAG